MTTKNQDIEVDGRQKTISIARTFNLPLITVWRGWTEVESFRKWWGPKDYTCPNCSIDFKVGGKNVACMKSPEGKEYWSTGQYVEIVPMKKIAYLDSFADSHGNPVSPSYYDMLGEWSQIKVTVTFEEVNGKAKITMEQEGVPEEMYDDCVTGWQQSFDKLESNLR